MVSKTKTLTENLKSRDNAPQKLQNASLSTKTKFEIFYGTYQQVVNALDTNKIPEHKIKGFVFVSPGTCAVIVHKH